MPTRHNSLSRHCFLEILNNGRYDLTRTIVAHAVVCDNVYCVSMESL